MDKREEIRSLIRTLQLTLNGSDETLENDTDAILEMVGDAEIILEILKEIQEDITKKNTDKIFGKLDRS